MIRRITTNREFSEMKNAGVGYVLITDTATGNKIHRVACSYVTSPNFYEKVILNDGKNGSYTWSDIVAELKPLASDVMPCSSCEP